MTAEVHDLTTRKNIGAAKGLLHSLVPRAQCFSFYQLDRSCIWSSDGADDYEIDAFVADLPGDIIRGTDLDSGTLRRTLVSGRTVLGRPVASGDDEKLGILVAVFSRNAGKSSWFNPSLLQNILQPAVQIIGETLSLNHKLAAAEERADVVARELELLYKVDENIHNASRRHAGLAQLIGHSGRFLNIAYSTLLLPSKRIRISATNAAWRKYNRKTLDKYLVSAFFEKMQGQRSPAVFDVPAVEGSGLDPEGRYHALLCPLLDQAGNIEGVVAQFGEIDKLSFDDSHIRFMSHIVRKVEYVIEQSFDAMTGMMNREGFEAQLHESGKSLTGSDDCHQIIYFDLDNLRLVNDTFGHDAGDDVIVRFAQLIDNILPRNAVATRLTGDDFVILLTHSGVDDAKQLVGKLQKCGDELRYLKGDKSLQVTFSTGVAEYSSATTGSKALMSARLACDAAKDHGRDRVEVYAQDNRSMIRRYDDMHLVSQIQQTLDGGGFNMLAQPIVPMAATDPSKRFEILLRMYDSDGKRVSSEAFFSAAERYQLMPQVDRWVVSSVLGRLSEHLDYLREHRPVFAINLSGQSLGDVEILKFIEEEFDSSGVPCESICFEVTESAAVSNRVRAQAFIDALRKRGCRFALDDFGAGLSSFAYLKNFKVDTLKIDGSFIRDIARNRISRSMVAAINEVAKVMELDTVAEYVENNQTRREIEKLGVHYGQGHAFGKPESFDKVLLELTGRQSSVAS